MTRLLFHILRLVAMISLVVSIGVAVLWARSYRHSQFIAAFFHLDPPCCVFLGVVQGGVVYVVNCEDTVTDSVTIMDTPAANQAPIAIPHLKYGFGCGAVPPEFRARMPAPVLSLFLLGVSAATWLSARRLRHYIQSGSFRANAR